MTVAAVIEKSGRFLMVDEETDQGRLFNQPAGHWDPGETLVEAVVRETLEETGFAFRPKGIVGIYAWHLASADATYLRIAFHGDAEEKARPIETTTYATPWMTLDDMRATQGCHRGPQVLRCAEDYAAGRRFPLELVVDLTSLDASRGRG